MKKNRRLAALAKEMSSFEVLELEPLRSVSGGCSPGGMTINIRCGGANAENGATCPETKAAEAATGGLSNRG